jgi:cytoskeleton protein RodZ
MTEQMDQQFEMTVGLRLQRARLEKNLSQLQVAEKLFLTTQIIEHLDDGAYHLIQKRAFIRGYIRAYARVVGLDGGALVAAYDAEVGTEEPSSQEPTILMNAEDPSLTKNPVFRAGALGLAALVVVIIFVWAIMSGESDHPPPPSARLAGAEVSASAAQTSPNAELAPVEGVGDDSRAVSRSESPSKLNALDSLPEGSIADASKDDALDAGAKSLDSESLVSAASDNLRSAIETPSQSQSQVMTNASQSRAGAATDERSLEISAEAAPLRSALGATESEQMPQVFRAVTDSGRFIQVIVDGADAVQINTEESCWVEVADAEGQLLYGDLNQAGDELEVIGTAPFQVLLGKASASTLRFNGQVIDLEPHTTREYTARLTLGDGPDAR